MKIVQVEVCYVRAVRLLFLNMSLHDLEGLAIHTRNDNGQVKSCIPQIQWTRERHGIPHGHVKRTIFYAQIAWVKSVFCTRC